ncbi:uncharacterized protein LOC143282173 [Babylonia areolata]|uniref:uncharacterized protein LOC143282173 n=1 Tax=Babylonia areolata TaxID=304850 RepID=UPI003FD69225
MSKAHSSHKQMNETSPAKSSTSNSGEGCERRREVMRETGEVLRSASISSNSCIKNAKRTEKTDVKVVGKLKEDTCDTDNDICENDILIETDESTDSDNSVSGAKKMVPTTSAEHFSSTPNMEAKRILIGRSHRKKCKRLVKKAKISLPKSKGGDSRLRFIKGPETDDSDSQWESLSDVMVSDGSDQHSAVDSSPDSPVEGPLFVDVDGSGEEMEGPQIPLQEQLEKTIADGSAKNNLSVSNVKNIIWTLLTHDLVKEMLATKLKACSDEGDDEDVFEPKLTRSKMKEVLEKRTDGRCWPVSPVKLGQSSSAGPSILDVEFADEEDDEDDEYQPSKDAAELESDDESITSSQVSDVGSPFPYSSPLARSISLPSAPSTPPSSRCPPVTPQMPTVSVASGLSSHKVGPSENVVSTMGPPVGLPPSALSAKQRLVFKSPEKHNKETEEDGIARRTRSKLPLTTTSLYDIEEAFVAPDITPDMYDTMCDDTDWQDFLKSLHKLGATDTHGESMEQCEDDDPEFNYTAEAEEIEPEEARFDGPFRVSRKELNGLLEELEDLFNEDDYSMIGLRTNLASAHQNAALLAKKPAGAADHTEESEVPPLSQEPGCDGDEVGGGGVTSVVEDVVAGMPCALDLSAVCPMPMVLEHQVKLIEEHMRKHVQLTTQMYVLAQGSDDFCPLADTCRNLMVELDRFREVSTVGPQSCFNACNLTEALEIMNGDTDWASHRQQTALQAGGSVSQQSASVLLADDLGTATAEGSGEMVVGKGKRKRAVEAGKKTSVKEKAGRISSDSYTEIARAQPPLLTVQREVMWTSRVFLYPSLLPARGLLLQDKVTTIGKFYFFPSEDALLVLGKEQFKEQKDVGVYKLIHEYMMPSRPANKLRLHFNRKIQNKDSIIQRYRQTGEVPKGPECAEEFSVEFVKAPCDQPDHVLPSWCKGHRRQLQAAQRRQQRLRLREERSNRRAEKRRRRETALGEQTQPEEPDGRLSTVGADNGSEWRAEDEQDTSDSSDESPAKVGRVGTRSEEAAETPIPSQPVTILSTLSSPADSTTSALLTSHGLYVPLEMADMAKLRQSLATSHAVVIGDSGEQKVVSMESYVRSERVLGDGELCHALSSLSAVAGSATDTALESPGPGEEMGERQEAGDGGCEHPDESRNESGCYGGSGGGHSHDEAVGCEQKECTCTEEESSPLSESSMVWQDSSRSETVDSKIHLQHVQTDQNSAAKNGTSDCTREEIDRELESCDDINSTLQGTVACSELAEDHDDPPCCPKEEMLCEQGGDDSVSPSDDSMCGLGSSGEQTGSGNEAHPLLRAGPSEATWGCDLTESVTLKLNSGPGVLDNQNTVTDVSHLQNTCEQDSIVDTRNPGEQSVDRTPNGSEASKEQNSDDIKLENTQQNFSAAANCHSSSSVHVGLIYHVHVKRNDDEIMQLILQMPSKEKLSLSKDCYEHLDVLQNMMRNSLEYAPCLRDKCMMQGSEETVKLTSTTRPLKNKLIKPGATGNIFVYMMYNADYTEAKATEDTAESPSSTTPDGRDGDPGGQGEASSQGQARDVRESSSDDCVSTTSDIRGSRSGERSERRSLPSVSTPEQGTEDLQSVSASSSAQVDSSCMSGSVPSHCVLPDVSSVSSAGFVPTLPAALCPGRDEEGMNSVSSSSLVRLANRGSVRHDSLPGSEVSSSDRSQNSYEQVQYGEEGTSMRISSLQQTYSGETPQVPSTSQAIHVQRGRSQDRTANRHSPLVQTSHCQSLGSASSTEGLSGPEWRCAVASSSPVVQAPAVGNVSWLNLSSVDSSADQESTENSSGHRSGISLESFSRQDPDSRSDVSTSKANERVGSVRENPSTSTGTVSESLPQESSVCSGDIFVPDDVFLTDSDPQYVGADHGCGVSNFSSVSSSGLSSTTADDRNVQSVQSSSREAADIVYEASTSSVDHCHHQGSGEECPMETPCSGRTTSLTHIAGQERVLQRNISKDKQNRRTLLRLIESGRNTAEEADCSQEGAPAGVRDRMHGAARTTAQAAITSASCEADLTAQAMAARKAENEASPVREYCHMQSLNERSPPPSYSLLSNEESPPAGETSPVQHMSQVSSAAAPCSPLALSDPRAPMVLSCLGLVPTKNADAAQTQTSAAQHQPDTGSAASGSNAKVIATLSPVHSSPTSSPTTYGLRHTAEKNRGRSPSASLRTLVPKPGPVTNPSPPRVPRISRRSPKKQQLQKQVRAILPKGYSYELKMNSPTKTAARTLKRRATLFCQRSPNKPLLPKDPSMTQKPAANRPHSGALHARPTPLLPWTRRGRGVRRRKPKSELEQAGGGGGRVVAAVRKPPAHLAKEDRSQEESDETGSEVEDVALMSQDDSQNEEEGGEVEDGQAYMHDLMAACTTIGFNPYIKTTPDKDGHCSKEEIRRQQKLSLLASDVLETDPRKDDRDLAYAQCYLNKVKVTLQKDLPTYTQFMDILRQFETSQVSPVEVYESVSGLLVNYPELQEEFAGFLQPGQALQTQCHVPNQLIHDIRAFIRRLELHYELKAPRHAKILRMVGKWDFKNKSPASLRDLLLPFLSTLPQHLHDDFLYFFPDVKPPESHMMSSDFETIRLREGDDDDDGNRSPDDFEDITFPDENDPYRTRRCPCICHRMSFTKRKKKEKYTHCDNCCLKVVDGQLYFQPSNVTTRRPVSATFYDPVPMPLPPDLPPPSAHSRGAFNCSAILDEADEDDHDDDLEDDVDTEDDKGTEDEKPETEEDDEKPDTDDDEDEEDEDEEDVEDEEEEEEEEDGKCSPTKQPRMAPVEEGVRSPLSSKETGQLSSQEQVPAHTHPQQPSLRHTLAQQPPSLQSIAQQTFSQHSPGQHPAAQPSVITQQPSAQQSLAQHSTAQRPELLAHPVRRYNVEEIVQPLAGRRPASPSPSQPLPPTVLTALPTAGLPGKKVRLLPKPGESNMRMRKRILSMQPGRQVSASMQSLAPKPGLTPESESAPELQSAGPSSTVSPLLMPPSGVAGASWKPPRIVSNKCLGTVSVVGPDNTVIMFNSSLHNPSLAETLPSLHEQRGFFPLPTGDQRAAGGGVGGSTRAGLGKATTDDGDKPSDEEAPSLPTITSPHKNMQRGSFAGLLQGTQPSDCAQPSLSYSSQEPGSSGSVGARQSPSSSTATTTTTIMQPLMSEDTLSALFEQMREGTASSSVSLPFDMHSNSSMSAMLSKMMQYPESRQEEADSSKQPADVTGPRPMDLSFPADPQPTSTTTTATGLSPVRKQDDLYQGDIDWTSEQDRMIVEMVRDHGVSMNTCQLIATRLQGVTAAQVSEHVSTLMEFLEVPEEEAAGEDV